MQDINHEQEKLNSFFEKGVWLVSLVQETRVLLRMLNRNKRHKNPEKGWSFCASSGAYSYQYVCPTPRFQ
jgi:hypothetical protein